MIRFSSLVLVLGATLLAGGACRADNVRNPTATFAGLDKITGRIISFDVAIDETVQFGTLQITPRVCLTRPQTETPLTEGFVEVDEIESAKQAKRIFSGWMFAASPGLHGVEHPVYDVWLKDCKGGVETVAAPNLNAPPPNAQAPTKEPRKARRTITPQEPVVESLPPSPPSSAPPTADAPPSAVAPDQGLGAPVEVGPPPGAGPRPPRASRPRKPPADAAPIDPNAPPPGAQQQEFGEPQPVAPKPRPKPRPRRKPKPPPPPADAQPGDERIPLQPVTPKDLPSDSLFR